jgi:hypothetical protein
MPMGALGHELENSGNLSPCNDEPTPHWGGASLQPGVLALLLSELLPPLYPGRKPQARSVPAA